MEQYFFSFIQQTRPEIGLVDLYNLSEIYDSDERYALSNIFLDPDGLDQIYNLSRSGVNSEDIRTIGGLERSVIHSMVLSNETLKGVSFNLSNQITTDKPLGEPGKHSFSDNSESDNVIVLHGGIAANNIEYKFLDENGDLRTTTVPTSRESLFNSEKDADGKFLSASYPGLFRIRRRSHFNTLRLSSKLLIPADLITESPTNTLNIPVYSRTPGNTDPAVNLLECYSTKNSPLILKVRINNSANIVFKRDPNNIGNPFVFGWELKRRSDLTLVDNAVITDSADLTTVTITLNTSGTIGNNTDCLLYIYLDPTAVNDLDLSGIGLTEDGGKDIGLVSFDNLKRLTLRNNRLSTIPVWLKTLDNTLEYLDIRGNSYWNKGIIEYFDYQTDSDGESVPNITAMQVLAYSGFDDSGKINGYTGSYDTTQDTSGNFYKHSRRKGNVTIDDTNGFRVFSSLKELLLGTSIRLKNADFSKIFPSLQNLNIDDIGDDRNNYSGKLPRLNNNNTFITFSMKSQPKLNGSLTEIGSTSEWDPSDPAWDSDKAAQFIGQFKIRSWATTDSNIVGGVLTSSGSVTDSKYNHIVSGSAADAWSGWLQNLQSFDIREDTNIAFQIANGSSTEWEELRSINISEVGDSSPRTKIRYNTSVSSGDEEADDIVNATRLTSIDAYNGGWGGKVFSIRSAEDVGSLDIGNNDWEGYTDAGGVEYFLPSNFVKDDRSSSLRDFYAHYLLNSSNRKMQFREDEFYNLPKLRKFYARGSYFRGKLPTIYNDSLTNGVNITFHIDSNRFRDVSSLAKTNRVNLIYSPNQGVSMGGCLLPVFNLPGGNTTLYYVHFGNSLLSKYPGNWHEAAKRNKPIEALITGTEEKQTLAGIQWTTDASEPEKLNVTSGSTNLQSYILVGDEVYDSSDNFVALVTQVDFANQFIYINSFSITLSGEVLSFKRKGQDISSYFENYRSLDRMWLYNNRLSGSLPSFTGDTRIRQLWLQNNLITTYQKGTLQNITGAAQNINSSARLNRFWLYNNPLTVQSVRDIISDLYDCAQYFASKNLRFNVIANIKNTKYNSSTKSFINYTFAEVFSEGSSSTDPATGETIEIPDPLLIKYNQLGPGNIYSGVRVEIF